MEQKKYKTTLIVVTLILFLAGQSVQFYSYLHNAKNTYVEISEMSIDKTFENTYNGIMSFLNDVDLFSEYICSQSSIEYVTRNYLLDQNTVDDLYNEVNAQSDMLNISSSMIEGYFLIGFNSLQKSFCKKFDSDNQKNREYSYFNNLKFENLLKSGLLEEFKNSPFIYLEDNVTMLNKIKAAFINNPAELKLMLDFYDEIKGKLIYYSLDKGGFMLIVVVNNKYFSKLTQDLNKDDRHLVVFDKYNKFFWSDSSSKDIIETIKDSNLGLLNEPREKFAIELYGHKYSTKNRTFGSYGLSLYYVYPQISFLKGCTIEILIHSAIALLFVLSVLLLANYSAKITIKPVLKMTSFINYYTGMDEVNIKNLKDHGLNSRDTKWSFKRRIINYLIITVLIPLIIYGFIMTQYIYSYITEQRKAIFIDASAQMRANLVYQISRYENLANILTASEIFPSVAAQFNDLNESEKKQIDLQLSKKTLSISDVKYFVLLNKAGVAKYQSIYSNNSLNSKYSNGDIYKFSLDEYVVRNLFSSSKDVFWVHGINDIFNNGTLSLVKKIKQLNEEHVGYFQMVFSQNAFQTVPDVFGNEFILTDGMGVEIYNSGIEKKYSQFLKSKFRSGSLNNSNLIQEKIGGIDTLITKEDVFSTDWNMYIFQRIDDLLSSSISLFKQGLFITAVICLGILLISLKLAEVLSKPINEIKDDMRKIVQNRGFNEPLEYNGYSEMEEFVKMYNLMISQIKALIEDNISIKIREQELVTLKTQAELNMLQQQINPHFLYNTLEVINMHVRRAGETSASKMIEALAQVFRFSTRTDNKTVLLDQEIDHVKNYIIIQQMRFENKFEVRWDIDDLVLNVRVLKLIIQPIVENAINHGLYEYSSGGVLEISVKSEGGYLVIIIKDNGLGMKEADLEKLKDKIMGRDQVDNINNIQQKKGGGIALRNVYRRLQIHYNGKASMNIYSKMFRGTMITLTLPIQES